MRRDACPPVRLGTCLLLAAMLYTPSSPHRAAAVQGSVTAANTAGLPTGTVDVALTLDVAPGVVVATLAMTLSVTAVNGSPALRRPISFTATATLPAPDVSATAGNDTIRIEWNTPWIPPRTGTQALGALQVRLPATAPGQEYLVEITSLSATSDGSTMVALVPVNGRIGRCSLLFSGQVSDAVTGVALGGAVACIAGGVPCVTADDHGLFGGLCYAGQSSAQAFVCADAAAYEQSCQGPWTPGGNAVSIDFRLLPAGTVVATPTPSPSPAACVGDCDGDGAVDISELTRGVNIGLGTQLPATCPAFDCTSACGPGPQPLPPASITCLMRAVNNALTACPPAPCIVDDDCDDGNPCSSDTCAPGGCTHTCICR